MNKNNCYSNYMTKRRWGEGDGKGKGQGIRIKDYGVSGRKRGSAEVFPVLYLPFGKGEVRRGYRINFITPPVPLFVKEWGIL